MTNTPMEPGRMKAEFSAEDLKLYPCLCEVLRRKGLSLRSQFRRVIYHRVKAGTRRLPQVVKGDGQKRNHPDKVKIRPISAKNAEETASIRPIGGHIGRLLEAH